MSAPPETPSLGPLTTETSAGITKPILDLLARYREIITVAILVVGCLSFHLLTLSSNPDNWPSIFANPSNLRAMLVPIAMDVIVAVGMLIVLVCGGFDLSVGSVLALAGLATGKVINATGSIPAAVLAGLTVGLVVGSVNGVVVTRFGVNPLIATLGTMSVARGLVLADTQAHGNTRGFPDAFKELAWSPTFGLDAAKLILGALVLAVVGDMLLRNSRWLRQVYYIGGNESAARLSGINVPVVRASAYMICGLLAALAGVYTASRYGEASGEAGMGLELKIIAACVIGGASLSGGQGTVLGAVLGCILMNVIANGLTGKGVEPAWQQVAMGTILIAAVTFDTALTRLRRTR